jgi:hypothetical protein
VATTLSSRWTPFYKFILPLFVLGGLGVGAWQAYAHPESVKMPAGIGVEYGWMLIVALMVFAVGMIWWTVAPLKRLELDDNELLISDYRVEIRVPLTSVASISGPSKTNPQLYTVTFEDSTEFGARIAFLPPMDYSFMHLGEPQEVTELRTAWELARNAATRHR